MTDHSSPDLVTQLQEQLQLLCSRIVDAVGPLQRDAPPASIRGEPVVLPAGTPPVDIGAMAATKAEEVASALAALRTLIEALPAELGSEEQEVGQLASALAANAKAAEEVAAAKADAEVRLARLQAAHALLAEARLRARD